MTENRNYKGDTSRASSPFRWQPMNSLTLVKRRASIRHPHRDEASTAPISLALIDDNRMLRETLAGMFEAEPGFSVLASTSSVEEVLDMSRDSMPEVVLLDVGLADQHSLSATRTLRLRLPEAKVIITGVLPAHHGIAELVRAGASGFIMRDASSEEFFDTIRQVASAARVLPKALTGSLFAQIMETDAGEARRERSLREAVRVTAREQEVIDLLAEGLSNKAIAKRMNIAVHTVKSHVHNVLEKLALKSRLEVAAFTHAASRESGDSNIPLSRHAG